MKTFVYAAILALTSAIKISALLDSEVSVTNNCQIVVNTANKGPFDSVEEIKDAFVKEGGDRRNIRADSTVAMFY